MNKLKRILKPVGIAALTVLLFGFLFRNMLLLKAVEYVSTKLKKNYSAELRVKDCHFSGLFTVQLSGISLLPPAGDTLVNIDTLELTPSLPSLLLFRLKLNSLLISNGTLNISCKDSSCNYSAFIKRDTTNKLSHEKNYADWLHHLFVKIFNLVPQNLHLSNIYLNILSDNVKSGLYVPYFNSENEIAEGILEDPLKHVQWKITGNFNQRKRKFNMQIFPASEHADFPLVNQLFHAAIDFDTINVSLDGNSYSKNVFQLRGNISSNGLSIYHKKISDDTATINNFSFDYRLNIIKTSIEADSSSLIVLDKIQIHPYISYSPGAGKRYTLDIHTDTLAATDFFHSLPAGMFDETRGIQADGKLQYSLHFRFNTDQPDSLEFNSHMTKEKFRIKKMGAENLFKLNDEFQYTAYEKNKPFRTFTIGPSNPDYTPLDQVSPYLRNAILTSEDGSFFFHNGFNEDAFRKSIAENYKKGGFARGGSTISMQLIKNVFLSRHKTIARKAQEALIVWLIESNRLCSKERMFEVYLNIIELGPGIYGVGEAGHFYFNKKPAALTLSESIFLASLLPHPKWFKYSFDEQGNLKPYLADYYRVVSNFMLRKNLISQSEYDEIQPNVKLLGPAKELVIPTDSIPTEEMGEE